MEPFTGIIFTSHMSHELVEKQGIAAVYFDFVCCVCDVLEQVCPTGQKCQWEFKLLSRVLSADCQISCDWNRRKDLSYKCVFLEFLFYYFLCWHHRTKKGDDNTGQYIFATFFSSEMQINFFFSSTFFQFLIILQVL